MATHHSAFGKLCEQACREEGWELLPSGIRLSLPDGRSQLVSLEFFEEGDEELVRIATAIGAVEALPKEQLVSALRVNGSLAHGALAVMHEQLAMVDTLLLRDADLNEIKASIAYLARTADSYEKTLFGTDTH